jgi:hypothetical protein
MSREQCAVLPSLLCLSQRCERDDAARARTTRGAPARPGLERFGKNRSVAGRADAPAARGGLRPGEPSQRCQLRCLICLIADAAHSGTKPSRPITLAGVHSVSAGSIEAIRSTWRSTAGRCLIRCKTPEPHGRMRTMRPRTRGPVSNWRGPAGGYNGRYRKYSAMASKPRRQPRTRSRSSGVFSEAIRIITSSASGWM